MKPSILSDNSPDSRRSTRAGLVCLLFTSLLISNCGVKQSDVDKLRSKNDSLVQLLAKKDINVKISNSIVTELESKYTGETYDIYVLYPNNYKNSGKKYPILVALDAEVNFGAVSYISRRLIKDELIPELFVVGVAYHGDTDEDTYYSLRGRDFTPTTDKVQEGRHKNRYQSGTGGAENFVKFLSLELLPYLANNYPTKNEERTIYGHSFGGLLGSHILTNHPTLFDNYLLLSPSLWWNEKAALEDLEQNPAILSKQVRVYIGTGALENSMVDDHLSMARILKKNNPGNVNIKSEILDRETHRSIFGRGFTNGLRFLYAKDSNE
jgi:predicted alpha/beta superfamily hydrolase